MAAATSTIDERIRRNGIKQLAIFAVWLTIVSGIFVFTEPAPVDVLSMGLVLLLPIVGLTHFRTAHFGPFAVLALLGATSLVGATVASDLPVAATHAGISVYLYATAIVLTAFITLRPVRHTELIANALILGGLLAALLGIAGYFDLFANAADWFVRNDRAAATFKDPNVFGSFLVVPMVLAGHRMVNGRALPALLAGTVAAIMGLAIILSFSRGAWLNLGVAGLAFAYLAFVTAKTHRQRLKLVAFVAIAVFGAMFLITTALQFSDVADLFHARAQLLQSYDAGPEGRFGGHLRAQGVILDHPLGIGALEFAPRFHPEDVHNVYLNMFLNAGWLGGFAYLAMVLATLVFGLSHALKRTPHQQLFIAVFAAFLGLVAVGFVVDTDHWRHFFVVMAMLWGMMSAQRRPARIIANRRRRRAPRIISRTRRGPMRPNRILGPTRRRMRPTQPMPRRRRTRRPSRPQRTARRS